MDELEYFQKIRDDPWEFLKVVRTKDEVDGKRPIKPFPVDKDYLKLYTRIWIAEKFVAVPKSRRMLMTWTNLCLYLWDTMFHMGRSNAFVSKKEDDSNELIEKCEFILQNLDHSILPKELVPKWERTYNRLRFKEIDSQIRGFPQGPDQLRQFTFSGIFFDEAAFLEDAEETYSAALPTLQGGGRCTMVSSAAPGFFKRVVFDQIEQGKEEEIIEKAY